MNTTSSPDRVSQSDLVEGIKVIDIDTHLSEPLDLWTSRATPKYRDRVPQMRMLDGKWTWTIDRDRSLGVGSASSVIYRDGSKAAGIGLGWIPFVLETLDYSLVEAGARRLNRLSMSPIEYFRRQMYASFCACRPPTVSRRAS
jgi:hypothetical protein